jgi:hypothetical protein
LTSVNAADAGGYSVEVSNGAGFVISAVATVTVNLPPTITTQPLSQTVTAGASVTLTVAASGSTPLSYQWKKDGVALAGAIKATLTLASVNVADAGVYTVEVSNGAGLVTSALATVSVNLPPTITTQPVNQTVTTGASITLTVAASGSAPLSYQWKKDGVALAGATNAIFALAGVSAKDAGGYTVDVSNSTGLVTSTVATLAVRGLLTAALERNSGQVVISFPAAGTDTFVLEFTDQLNSSIWTTWPGPVVRDNGAISLNVDARTNSARFFRVRFP